MGKHEGKQLAIHIPTIPKLNELTDLELRMRMVWLLGDMSLIFIPHNVHMLAFQCYVFILLLFSLSTLPSSEEQLLSM